MLRTIGELLFVGLMWFFGGPVGGVIALVVVAGERVALTFTRSLESRDRTIATEIEILAQHHNWTRVEDEYVTGFREIEAGINRPDPDEPGWSEEQKKNARNWRAYVQIMRTYDWCVDFEFTYWDVRIGESKTNEAKAIEEAKRVEQDTQRAQLLAKFGIHGGMVDGRHEGRGGVSSWEPITEQKRYYGRFTDSETMVQVVNRASQLHKTYFVTISVKDREGEVERDQFSTARETWNLAPPG